MAIDRARIEEIRSRYRDLAPVMDERVTRLWAAGESKALGRGGIAAVTEATGILKKRIRHGIRDLGQIQRSPPSEPPRGQRVRRPGAGRKPLTEKDPTLVPNLESLIDPLTRGDPESPLRWTCKSVRKLAKELGEMGHKISAQKVSELLHDLGYSLQGTRKTREGSAHPDRNAQFEHINAQARAFQREGEPSVDTKKKELVGDFANHGKEWQPAGEPVPVRVHDFIDRELGKAVPYGVYDIARNEGWVNVGINHDTSEFAVESLRRWWRRMGRRAYPNATRLPPVSGMSDDLRAARFSSHFGAVSQRPARGVAPPDRSRRSTRIASPLVAKTRAEAAAPDVALRRDHACFLASSGTS